MSSPPAPSDLTQWTARDLAAALHDGRLSALEVMTAHLDRIERVNPTVNALCTVVPETALEEARAADERRQRGEELGLLHGLPIAIKDLVLTAGIRTTFGSPLFADHVPDQDDLMVRRIREAGACVIGKTNTPEWGAGSQTFNPVFGATRNPWDLTKTCGGSSGGAASALASGLLPIADGSDLGGSLRNPASFCGVVGFRPSPGRVPRVPSEQGWDDLPVLGPMARNVRDTRLLFAAIAGPDPRTPTSRPEAGKTFLEASHDIGRLRLGWTPDLGGYPVQAKVIRACERAIERLRTAGHQIEAEAPDLEGADEAFRTLRAWTFASRFARMLERSRDQLKDTIIWNIESGLSLSGIDIARAYELRTAIYGRVLRFFSDFDLLLLPTVQVLPFDVETEYPTEINGQKLHTYLDWMASCYAITVTSCPAISLPCGFSEEGLPVGLQVVGAPGNDQLVLDAAEHLEEVLSVSPQTPLTPERAS